MGQAGEIFTSPFEVFASGWAEIALGVIVGASSSFVFDALARVFSRQRAHEAAAKEAQVRIEQMTSILDRIGGATENDETTRTGTEITEYNGWLQTWLTNRQEILRAQLPVLETPSDPSPTALGDRGND
jgi:hypothetical protein